MVARFSYLGPILEATKAIPKDVPVDEAGRPNFGDLTQFVRIAGYRQQSIELSYDGTHFYVNERRNSDLPDTLLIYSREHAIRNAREKGLTEEIADRRWLSNYCYEAGFVIPTSEFSFDAPHIKSLILHLADRGSKIKPDGSKGAASHLITLRVQSDEVSSVFHLDPSLGYMVRRRDDFETSEAAGAP